MSFSPSPFDAWNNRAVDLTREVLGSASPVGDYGNPYVQSAANQAQSWGSRGTGPTEGNLDVYQHNAEMAQQQTPSFIPQSYQQTSQPHHIPQSQEAQQDSSIMRTSFESSAQAQQRQDQEDKNSDIFGHFGDPLQAATKGEVEPIDDSKIPKSHYTPYTPEDPDEAAVQDAYDQFWDDEEERNRQSGNDAYFTNRQRTFGAMPVSEQITLLNENGINDGASDSYDKRTSMYVTGEQLDQMVKATHQEDTYKRPLNTIDPEGIYNLYDEKRDFDFIPYIPDEGTRQAYEDGNNILHRYNTGVNNLAGLRDDGIDYKVFYNGQEYSGNELDKMLSGYIAANSDEYTANLANMYATPEEAGPNAIPYKAEYMNYHVGDQDIQIHTSSAPVEQPMNADGTITSVFDNGESFSWDPNDGVPLMTPQWIITSNPEEADAWAPGVEPLTLSDGRQLSYQDAVNIYMGNGTDYDYGFANMGKPRDKIEFNQISDILPWTVDLVLGSAPLFSWPTSILQGVSGAMEAAHGVDANSRKSDGSYSRPHEGGPTDEQYLSSIAGNLLMPFTERLIGNVGGRAIGNKIGGALERTVGERSWLPIAETFGGISGEALEEVVPGSLVDELINNGVNDFYANDLVDENGETVYDASGHAVKDTENTTLQDRLANFFGGQAENLAGGAMLGSLFGVPELFGVSIPKAKRMYQRNKSLKSVGLQPTRTQAQTTFVPDDLQERLDALFQTPTSSSSSRRR